QGIGAGDQRPLESSGRNPDHRGLLQTVNGIERGLDLAQLDSIASALDLGIGSAEEVDEAVVSPDSGEVARLIEAIDGVQGAWILQKRRGGSFGISPVPWAQADTPDVEIPNLAVGNWLQSIVQDQELLTVAFGPDRDLGARVWRTLRYRIVTTRDGGLRRTVEIGEAEEAAGSSSRRGPASEIPLRTTRGASGWESRGA